MSKIFSPKKNFGPKIIELFLKIIALYVSDHADRFKPIKKFNFHQFTQFADCPLNSLSENFVFNQKVVPYSIATH